MDNKELQNKMAFAEIFGEGVDAIFSCIKKSFKDCRERSIALTHAETAMLWLLAASEKGQLTSEAKEAVKFCAETFTPINNRFYSTANSGSKEVKQKETNNDNKTK